MKTEKWWISHNVDIISILSVWAISNSSLYRGYQLFHVAYIHSRVVKRKKNIKLCTPSIIQRHLEENFECDEYLEHMFDVLWVWVFWIINWACSTCFFQAIFSMTKTHIMKVLKSVLCICQKFFLWKIFCMKSAEMAKNIVCVKWISWRSFRAYFSLYYAKKCG